MGRSPIDARAAGSMGMQYKKVSPQTRLRNRPRPGAIPGRERCCGF